MLDERIEELMDEMLDKMLDEVKLHPEEELSDLACGMCTRCPLREMCEDAELYYGCRIDSMARGEEE